MISTDRPADGVSPAPSLRVLGPAAAPSRADLEAVEWGREAVRRSPAVVLEGLRHLVTLTTALLAGSAALIAQLPAARAPKALAVLLLLAALGLALWGALPRKGRFAPDVVEESRAERDRTTAARTRLLWAAAACLYSALAVLLGGVLAAL